MNIEDKKKEFWDMFFSNTVSVVGAAQMTGHLDRQWQWVEQLIEEARKDEREKCKEDIIDIEVLGYHLGGAWCSEDFTSFAERRKVIKALEKDIDTIKSKYID